MGGSIAEVDEINGNFDEGTTPGLKNGGKNNFIQYDDDDISVEPPGSDEDEIDDLYYNQKILAKKLDK